MSNTKQITEAVMALEGVSRQELAERLGDTNKNAINQRFLQGITIDTMYKYLTPLGYEFVVRKKDSKTPEFVIEK